MKISIDQLIRALAKWEVYENYREFEIIFGYRKAPKLYHKFMTKGRNFLPFYTSLNLEEAKKLTDYILSKIE